MKMCSKWIINIMMPGILLWGGGLYLLRVDQFKTVHQTFSNNQSNQSKFKSIQLKNVPNAKTILNIPIS